MHSSLLLTTLLTTSALAANIVQVNDDGWAEINIRVLYDTLTAAGESVVLSAPALNQSGTASLQGTPSTVTNGCEFDSCPPGSPPEGYNSSNPRLNYVNSYPVTAMKYGVQTLSPQFFGGNPDIVVSGPNVGSNLGITTVVSGTVGAASAAMDQLGIPGIAFSGATGMQTAWDVSPVPDYATIYAQLATKLTTTLLASGAPYLPNNTWLNVNFPAAGAGTSCTDPDKFQFVLSRIYTAVPLISGEDVVTCNNGGRLPTESDVVGTTTGCYASVSVGHADDKLDADASQQAVVLQKLSSILTCLPSS
ncbi:hypothetical protein VTN77DRAFT_4944 [Rasamsonia byssochlamydoides]|uniref:uncharacterized protein n=1 Tax=Rasamsonia byssochlamydoides TaxID=89139 RepID=UPI003744B1CC